MVFLSSAENIKWENSSWLADMACNVLIFATQNQPWASSSTPVQCGTLHWLLAWVEEGCRAAQHGFTSGFHTRGSQSSDGALKSVLSAAQVGEDIKYFNEQIFQNCYLRLLIAVFHAGSMKRWRMFLEEVGVGFYWVRFCSGGQVKTILPQKLLTLKAISHLKLWLEMTEMVFAVTESQRKKVHEAFKSSQCKEWYTDLVWVTLQIYENEPDE